MPQNKNLTTRALGLASAAVAMVGVVSLGPTAIAPAAAGENAGSAFITNGTLVITGSNHDDVVTLAADPTSIQVTLDGDAQRFDLTAFNAISVSLGNGDDQFTEPTGVLGDKPVTIDGGNGNDTIQTGDAKDVVTGGNGDDHVDAGKGNDTVVLGNGNDFFVWNPGEGSDAVDGGNGQADVMQFNGADANETMSLAANGPAAVFLRSPGAVRMDMNGIEVFNLSTFGGVDALTVDNLEGSGLRQANVDLSAVGGGGDHAADVITVNGTDQSDRVGVDAAGGGVAVAGLPAGLQITGSETSDHLQVDTLDGNDRVTVDPAVSTLISVAVDLGLGQL